MRSCGGAERRVTCDAEGCHNHNVGVTCPTESSGILRKSGRDDAREKSRARVDFKAVFNTNESSSSSKDMKTAAPSAPDPISPATVSQSKNAKSQRLASPEEDLLNCDENEFYLKAMNYMIHNGRAMLHDDNPVVTRMLRDFSKNLPDLNKWHGKDLTDNKQLSQMVARIHHNTGSYKWNQFAKQLITANVPRKIYEAAREHCKKCDRTKLTGSRPLSRPAAFPMASDPFEVVFFDFVHLGEVNDKSEFLHMIDAFARYSILARLKYNKNCDVGQSEAVCNAFITQWIAVFGAPKVVFIDPDTRLNNTFALSQLCEIFGISLIPVASKHHQSFGAVERHNIIMQKSFAELQGNSDFIGMSHENLAAIVQLVHNGVVSPIDGFTPGHRVFGRAPRLPIPSTETATLPDRKNSILGMTSKNRSVLQVFRGIIACRNSWGAHDTDETLIRAATGKGSKEKAEQLYGGQSVYFFHDKSSKKGTHWRGPGVIVGRTHYNAWVQYNCYRYEISLQNCIPVDSIFTNIGPSDALEFFSKGGKQSLENVPNIEFLESSYFNIFYGNKKMPRVLNSKKSAAENFEHFMQMERDSKNRIIGPPNSNMRGGGHHDGHQRDPNNTTRNGESAENENENSDDNVTSGDKIHVRFRTTDGGKLVPTVGSRIQMKVAEDARNRNRELLADIQREAKNEKRRKRRNMKKGLKPVNERDQSSDDDRPNPVEDDFPRVHPKAPAINAQDATANDRTVDDLIDMFDSDNDGVAEMEIDNDDLSERITETSIGTLSDAEMPEEDRSMEPNDEAMIDPLNEQEMQDTQARVPKRSRPSSNKPDEAEDHRSKLQNTGGSPPTFDMAADDSPVPTHEELYQQFFEEPLPDDFESWNNAYDPNDDIVTSDDIRDQWQVQQNENVVDAPSGSTDEAVENVVMRLDVVKSLVQYFQDSENLKKKKKQKKANCVNFIERVDSYRDSREHVSLLKDIDGILENLKMYDEFACDPLEWAVNEINGEVKNIFEYQSQRGWLRDTSKLIELEQIGSRREIPEGETFNHYGNAARKRELKAYYERDAIEEIKRSSIPKGQQILNARFVYTMKSDPVTIEKPKSPSHGDDHRRLDARLCVQGHPETMAEDVQSPTAQIETTRTICAIIPILKWNFAVIDVSRAYLQSHDLERDVYVRPPKGAMEDHEIYWKAKKPLYGLADSTKNWAKTVIDFAISTGAVQSTADPSLFLWTQYKREEWNKGVPSAKVADLNKVRTVPPETLKKIKNKQVFGLCTVYVDDLLYAGDIRFMKWFEKEITTRFTCKKPEWNNAKYLGMRIRAHQNGTVTLTSDGYEANIGRIPITKERKAQEEDFLTEPEERAFRNVLGKAMWSARIARADLTYEVAAIAQAYAHGRKLVQNYEMEDLTKASPYKDEDIKIPDEEMQQTSGNDHMPGFDDFVEVNKINIHKPKRPPNSGENFRTHLKVKNLNYLNKVVNKIKTRDNDTDKFVIKFTDVTKGRGVDDVRILLMTDGALMNVEDKKSQIGMVGMLMSKTEQYKDPDFSWITPDQASNKKPKNAYPYVEASPILWKSQRSPRVANSSQAAEIFGLFMGLDAAIALRSLVSEILYATPLKEMVVDVRNDNLTVVRSVHQMGNMTTEKRLQGLIQSMKLTIQEENVASVSWIDGKINIADEFTKSTDGNMITALLTENRIQVPDEEVLFEKYQRTHTDRQYLINTEHYPEMKQRVPSEQFLSRRKK